jgi:protein FAM50
VYVCGNYYIFLLQSSTIGLVTLDEMKAKQENIVKERERRLAQKQLEKEQEKQRQLEAKQAEKNRQEQQVNCVYDLKILL